MKQIAADILGLLCIIGSIVTSPIPGPGGLPLLILGLGLLSTNHAWAARWLEYAKQNGGKFSQRIFSKHPTTRWAIDLLGVFCIALAVVLVTQLTRSTTRTAAMSLVFLALFLLLGNRERLQTIRRNLFRPR